MEDRIPFLASPALNTSPNVEAGLEQLRLVANRTKMGETLSEDEVREVAKKFEAMLLHQLVSAMRRTVPEDPLFGESSENRIYREMLDEEIAAQMAEAGQTGIGDAIAQEILRQQQIRTPPAGDSPFRPIEKPAPTFRSLDDPVRWRPLESSENPFRPIDRGEPEFRPLIYNEKEHAGG